MTEVFEYALVRVVPRVERGEVINAGVIVYSHRHRYLAVRIELDVARLLAKLGDIVGIQVRHYYPLPFPEPTVRKANAVRDAYEKASTAE